MQVKGYQTTVFLVLLDKTLQASESAKTLNTQKTVVEFYDSLLPEI